jgi:hypothetical protein
MRRNRNVTQVASLEAGLQLLIDLMKEQYQPNNPQGPETYAQDEPTRGDQSCNQ